VSHASKHDDPAPGSAPTGGSEPSTARPPDASDTRASAARALGRLDVDALLADPTRKQSFVTPMFDVIAPRYDAFTRLFSFGMDAGWKRRVVHAVMERVSAATARTSSEPTTVVLDLACGTGDLAIGMARVLTSPKATVRVLGIDASAQMTRFARARLHGPDGDVAHTVAVATGDMVALPIGDAAVDVITAGYGVRNAPDPVLAIREAARVLRMGGWYVTLDFYRPVVSPWRALFLWYLTVAGNLVGWTWHRSPVVYGYIARSIDHFMSWQAFSQALNDNGFKVRSVTRWLGGGVALHVAERVR
jgi:demethylmenaquinone methyltransferase / 2-methoxy-6-polyprenyl-1,4-benzoquinol methylase